jgi:hypothetical protein
MVNLLWSRERVFDGGKLATAVVMLATPWLLELGPAAKWDLWICGYAIATICVADLTADADWEPRTSLWLGVWLAAAPWVLGFTGDLAASFLHLLFGSVVSLLSAVELWSVDHTPPRRFRPGAARHAEVVGSADGGAADDQAAGSPILVRDRFVPAPKATFLGSRRRPARLIVLSALSRVPGHAPHSTNRSISRSARRRVRTRRHCAWSKTLNRHAAIAGRYLTAA